MRSSMKLTVSTNWDNSLSVYRPKCFEAFIEAMPNGEVFAENWGHLCII